MEWCKIMVVDDEYLLRQGILHMLDWEKYGFSIVGEATNATQALELIEKVHPHIILCDIVMPNIDGIELSKIIKKRYPEIEIVILSGYDNFDYVKTAFKHGVADYVLKPTITAEQLLSILLPLQKKSGQPINIAESEKDIGKQLLTMLENKQVDKELMSTHFKEQEFTVIGYWACNEEAVDVGLANDKIDSIFKEFHHIYLGESENVHIFVMNHPYEDRLAINRKWDELTGYLEAKIMDVMLMKIYRIKSIEALFRGYDALKDLSQYHFYGYEHQYICISLKDIKKRDTMQFDTKIFMQKATSADPIAAIGFLESYLNSLNYNNGVKSNEVKAVVQNAIYNLINVIQLKEENYEEVNTKKILFFNDISNAKTLKDIMRYFYEIDVYIKGLIGSSSASDKMMKQITDYIHMHYNEQISLQEIANELHISYSYLSAYFNNHHDEGFNDYLNSVRIEKAKGFLVDPTIQISYVSELVGYSSPGYFTKVFKKLLGITPSTYRRMYMK